MTRPTLGLSMSNRRTRGPHQPARWTPWDTISRDSQIATEPRLCGRGRRTSPNPTGQPTRRRTGASSALALVVAASVVCVGCVGAPAFSSRFPENRAKQVEALVARLAAAPAGSSEGIAIGVSPAPTQLYAYDLRGRSVLWRHTAEVSYTPMLAGPRVVTQEGSQVVARDLKSGQTVFSLGTDGMTLNGAAGNGPHTAVVLTSGQGTLARGRVSLIQGSSTKWRHDFSSQAGVPAIVGDVVLVPWSTQFVTALDLNTGEEIARLLVRDGVVSHAFSANGTALVGSRYGYAVVDRQLGRGSIKQSRYRAAPEQVLPGRPKFLRDVYDTTPVQAPDSAQHRVRLEWAPEVTATSAKLQDGLQYLVFYRFVFALEQDSLDLHWVYTHESDIVGARAQAGGLAFADETGGFGLLSASSGTLAWSAPGGIPSSVAVLPRGGVQAGPGGGGAPDPESMRRQLLLAAQDPDARLVPVRVLAVDLLSSLPDGAVTGDLVGLCDDRRTSPAVRKQACEALQQRASGGEHIRSALERHYGYLEGTTSPPVGALAKASAVRKDAATLPQLIAHLKDPNTRSEDLLPLVQAIQALGKHAAVAPLADFLRLYHADPVDEHVVSALEATTQALAELAGPVALTTLSEIADDPLTVVSLRRKARLSAGRLEAVAKAAEHRQRTAQSPQEPPAAAQVEVAEGPVTPERLTLTMVSQALLPVRDQLRACLDQGGDPLFRARVVVVVEDGRLLMVSVNPKALEGCIAPLVKAQSFPTTKYAKREQITYTVSRN